MAFMGVHWEGGRASSAPELEGFDWCEWGVRGDPGEQYRARVSSAGQLERNDRARVPSAGQSVTAR
eukprot:5363643-Alexandrium_andersonii.AAC.1